MKGKLISGDVLETLFRYYDEIEADCNAEMKFGVQNIQEPERYIRMRDLQCKYSALNSVLDILGLKKTYIDYWHAQKRKENRNV